MVPWQLHIIGIEGKTSTVQIESDAKARDLFDKVFALSTIKGITSKEHIRLIFGGKELLQSDSKTLDDYNIINGSNIHMVIRLPGGINPSEMMKLKKEEVRSVPGLRELPGQITLTHEPDQICSLDDSEDVWRAKMSCGHVVASDSMTAYSRSLLDEGCFHFTCPYKAGVDKPKCGQEWPYFVVRHVATFTQKEMAEFDKKLSENYMQRSLGCQQCPACKTWCSRQDIKNNRVICSVCTKTNEARYEFCWACLHQITADKCSNPACDGRDPRLKILANCDKVTVGGKVAGAPSIRGCPRCGTLINYFERCKHMDCPGCKGSFCFVCLSLKDLRGNWTCGGPYEVCPVAAVQSALPGA